LIIEEFGPVKEGVMEWFHGFRFRFFGDSLELIVEDKLFAESIGCKLHALIKVAEFIHVIDTISASILIWALRVCHNYPSLK
jgi:hypothetical protein